MGIAVRGFVFLVVVFLLSPARHRIIPFLFIIVSMIGGGLKRERGVSRRSDGRMDVAVVFIAGYNSFFRPVLRAGARAHGLFSGNFRLGRGGRFFRNGPSGRGFWRSISTGGGASLVEGWDFEAEIQHPRTC